eukprot:2218034-Pleurochrysis_carterae.AAC.1
MAIDSPAKNEKSVVRVLLVPTARSAAALAIGLRQPRYGIVIDAFNPCWDTRRLGVAMRQTEQHAFTDLAGCKLVCFSRGHLLACNQSRRACARQRLYLHPGGLRLGRQCCANRALGPTISLSAWSQM